MENNLCLAEYPEDLIEEETNLIEEYANKNGLIELTKDQENAAYLYAYNNGSKELQEMMKDFIFELM